MKNLARIVEALLFTAQGPLKIDSVVEAVPEADREAVEAAIEELRHHYERSSRAFQVVRIAGGYQLLTRPDVAPWVEKFLVGRRRQRLSRAALEVLSVVAYRQPVTRGEVEAIRGVDCGGVFHTLLERGMVAVKGRAKRVGNPLLYVTTDRFMEHFGIEDISELPKMEEFEALLDRDAARAELQDAGVIRRAIAEDEPPAEDLAEPAAEFPEPTADSERTVADVREPVVDSPGEGTP